MSTAKQKEVDKKEEEKRALTVRMNDVLYTKIEEVAEELGQKAAAVARNYLNLASYIFVKSTLEITTRDNSPMMLLPTSIFELMISVLRTSDEKNQIDVGDKLASMININSDIGAMKTFKEKIEFIKVLGWFQSVSADFLKIPRRFGPTMFVLAFVYRLITKKKLQPDWTRGVFLENLGDPKYEKNKDLKPEKVRIQAIRDDFTARFGNPGQIFNEQLLEYDFYEFDKLILKEPPKPDAK